jgi:hypothetical protein
MAKNAFAPVAPGDMLKEEFLVEYGLSQNQLAKAIRDRQQSATHHRRHCTPIKFVLRQQSGILDEFTNPLRSENCEAKS